MELKNIVLDFRFLLGGLRFVCYVINAMRIKSPGSLDYHYKNCSRKEALVNNYVILSEAEESPF